MVSRETLREWRAGFSDAWTVGLGLVPLGLAFGLLITQSGFSWWWAPILSLVIYAGSMEFLAIGMITAGVGIIPAAVTGFMVNFRHIFYGLTFPRHLIRNFWARAYSTYALTDESYAIVSARAAADDGHRMTASRMLSIQVVCQLAWVLPGIIGALAGTALPDTITGMDFALTALFLVLAWESFASPQRRTVRRCFRATAAWPDVGARFSVLFLSASYPLSLPAYRRPTPHRSR